MRGSASEGDEALLLLGCEDLSVALSHLRDQRLRNRLQRAGVMGSYPKALMQSLGFLDWKV